MKIALLIPGQARFINTNWDNIQSQLLEVDNVDVFCHFWDTVDPRWDNDPYKALEFLQPSHYIIEKQLDFDDPNLFSTTNFTEIDSWKYRRACSQFYSIWRVFSLMDTYSKLNGKIYDCVIKARTDIVLKNPFDPEEFASDPQALWFHNVINAPEGILYDDELVFGNPNLMSQYCNAYYSIPEAFRHYGRVCNASFWRYHILLNRLDTNVKVSKTGRVDIVRNDWHTKRIEQMQRGEVPKEDE